MYLKDIFDDFTDDDGTDNDSVGNFIPNRRQDNSEAKVTDRKEHLLPRQHHIPHEHRDKVSTRFIIVEEMVVVATSSQNYKSSLSTLSRY